MKTRTLLFSIITISIAAYLGSERGSYNANYYWVKLAFERKEKREAALEARQRAEATQLRQIIEKGLSGDAKYRWKRYN